MQANKMKLPPVAFVRRCPHCKSVDFRSVGSRNFVEKALHWIMPPFRCCLCGHHFYLVRWLTSVAETT
jgi:hypothetical protein